jgi:MoaA/NifB/PqqE/SkfB family radical SAM enzyme/SAM-dependent methyltransferase
VYVHPDDAAHKSARLILRAILSVCRESNNRCPSKGVIEFDLTLKSIEERIRRLKDLGVSTVILSGGEPTIRPDFLTIAATIRNHGMNFGAITNGRMFSYKDIAGGYAIHDPEYTEITVFSHDLEVHDAIAGVDGAFRQTLSGIKNIAGKLKNVTVRVLLNNRNAGSIKEISDLVWRLGLKPRLKFSIGSFSRINIAPYLNEATDIREAADSVSEAISYGIERYGRHGMTFCWEGFAPCHIKDYPGLGTDLLSEDVAYVWEELDGEYKAVSVSPDPDDENDECLICSRRKNCFNTRGDYRRVFMERIPNAVGYNYSGELKPDSSSSCPAGAALCAELHPLRDVAVLKDGTIEVYHSDGGYGGHVMKEVKFSRGQVYLNISGRSRNLDFRTAFKRVVLHEKCRECVLQGTRSGVFVPLEGNAFNRVEEDERVWIEGLKGRALDVGCGRPLFPEILERKIAAGEIEYLGVDRYAECPEIMKTVAVDFEDFEWDGESFDHIMMLRSYNHFRDPRLILRKAAMLLNPGGLLHIFENGLFAILKRNVADDRPDGGQPPYKHFRNSYSEDVVRLLDLMGDFEVAGHAAVAPERANQWFLTLRKKQVSGLSETGGNGDNE